MNESTRRNVCRLIAGIVVADDDLDQAEDAFINRMLERFGLQSEGRDALFPIMDEKEAAQELALLPSDIQTEVMDLLVQAAAADGRYAQEEKGFLHAVAKVMGIASEEADRRVMAQIQA